MDALEPEHVADSMVEAILCNQTVLYLPKLIYVFILLKGSVLFLTFYRFSLLPLSLGKSLSRCLEHAPHRFQSDSLIPDLVHGCQSESHISDVM